MNGRRANLLAALAAALIPVWGLAAAPEPDGKPTAQAAIRDAADLEVALAKGDAAQARILEERIRALGGDALQIVERETQTGNPDARFAAGLLLSRGLLGVKDGARACVYFARAAEVGHVAGEYHAALCLLGADPARAARLMQAAAASSHPAAQEALGRACLEDRRARNLDCAVRNLAAAAKAGRPSAQSLFAWLHGMGMGVEREPITALALYLLAARQGDPAAQNNLGELYETGVEGFLEKNPRRAALWYEAAAIGGFGPGQYNLGRLYATGVGLEKDLALSRLWLGKAEVWGVPSAIELLRQLPADPSLPPR